MSIRLLPALSCLLLLASPSRAATTVADAFVTPGPSGNLAANNYGAAGALAISGAGTTKGAFASVLRFDVSSDIAGFDTTYGVGGWTISSVSLQLTTSTVNNALFNASSAGQFDISWISSDSWVEGTGNPNTPSVTGVNNNDLASLLTGAESEGIFAFSSVADGVAGTYTFVPGSSMMNDLIAGGLVSLALTAVDANMSALVNSRNFGTAGRRPALTMTATAIPEPGRLAFLCLGLLGLLTRRQRSVR